MRSALVRIPDKLAAEGIRLRPEQPADDPYLIALYRTTREVELAQVSDWDEAQKQAFILMQFNAQRVHYRSALTDVSFDVIERNGQPIGRLYVREMQTALHVVDILLDPKVRGSGIGTALLECLAADAHAAGKVLGIFVEINNPARRLYDRLGFVPISQENGYYIEMEIPLPEDQPAAAVS